MLNKIFLSVGHGGKDSGAVGNGMKESDMTLKLSKAIANILDVNGIEYMLSRTSDEYNNQATRIEKIKKYNPDLMLDIHFNAFNGKATGTEVYYQHDDNKSKNLAEKISSAVASYLKITNRGAKKRLLINGKDYYGMLRNCPCTAVLIETCFIDNPNDMKGFINAEAETLNGTAEAIVKSICLEYGIDYKEDKDDTVPEEPNGAKFKIGDKVIINGDLYKSANANKAAGSVKNKNTVVTRYAEGTKHPYNTTGDLGWMDEESLTLAEDKDSIYQTMKVVPAVGLWLNDNDKRWNKNTHLALMPQGATVKVYKGSEKKLGKYTSVKAWYGSIQGYCAKEFLK